MPYIPKNSADGYPVTALGAAGAVMLAINVPKTWLNGIIAVIIVSVGIVILATIRKQFQYRKRHMVLDGNIAACNKGLSGRIMDCPRCRIPHAVP